MHKASNVWKQNLIEQLQCAADSAIQICALDWIESIRDDISREFAETTDTKYRNALRKIDDKLERALQQTERATINYGETRCPKKYFHVICGKDIPLNGWWACTRCLKYSRLTKELKSIAHSRLVPNLTPDWCTKVNNWLHGIDIGSNAVMGTLFNVPITQGKFACLRDATWVNDEIINTYLQLLLHKHKKDLQAKPSFILPSFFYTRLAEDADGYNYLNVRRWTKHRTDSRLPFLSVEGDRWLNIFQGFDKVYIPINITNAHWFLVILFMDKKVVCIYDSLKTDRTRYFDAICNWLKDECAKLKLDRKHSEGWKMETVECPQQTNGFDCGVFSLVAADMVMLDLPLLYDQAMMPRLRMRIGFELFKACSKANDQSES